MTKNHSKYAVQPLRCAVATLPGTRGGFFTAIGGVSRKSKWGWAAALCSVALLGGCGDADEGVEDDGIVEMERTAEAEQRLVQVTGSYGQSVRGTVDGFPFLMLRGTHTERGKAHGVLAAAQVINSVNSMAAYLNGSGVLTWNDAISGLGYFNIPSRYISELTGMLAGIQEALPNPSNRVLTALGREITLDDLKVLQIGDMLELAQCSQFSAWGNLTSDGNTVIGRNWDYAPLFSMADASIIANDPTESGLLSTMDAMWFGMVGTGMATIREDGLYVSANDASIDENGIPFANPQPSMLVARDLAETVPMATAPATFASSLANRVPLALIFHISFPVPHPQSRLPTVIEYDSRVSGGYGTKSRTAVAPLSNAIVLTNHFLLSAGAPAPSDSVSRYNTLYSGIQTHANAGTKIGFTQARDLMASVARSNTLYSAVAWPGQRKLMVATAPSSGVPATSGTYVTANWTEIFSAVPPSGTSITQQPTDRTVTVGQTATFTVTASGSNLTYQWQKNGVNISGATSASYTTPATLYNENGTAFRCVVGSSSGSVTSNSATLVVNSTATSPTGIRGQYYATTNFTNLYATYTDPYVNFTWGPEGDNFSIRWTGQVQPAYSEAYTFRTTSDGAVRVWLNNQLIIDHWTLHNSTASLSSAPITLVAGRRYNVQVDYYDTVNTSVIQLYWQSASQPQQIIPTNRLYLP